MDVLKNIIEFEKLASKRFYLEIGSRKPINYQENIPIRSRKTKELGLFFQQLRQQAKVSQQSLAIKMHSSQSMISYFETGWGNPSLEFIDRYCQAIGVKVSISFLVEKN